MASEMVIRILESLKRQEGQQHAWLAAAGDIGAIIPTATQEEILDLMSGIEREFADEPGTIGGMRKVMLHLLSGRNHALTHRRLPLGVVR